VPTTAAFRSAFITDAFLSASDNIYKGGTDDADVNTWLWKQAGPSPDKDDIEHAFAAEYSITAAGPYQNHKVLFFGGDRLANVGSTNIGLWFFQNSVTTGGTKTGVDANGNPTCSVNSGCGFTGTHKVGNKSLGGSAPGACGPNPPAGSTCIPGDLFILSAFTNGGAQPTIKVFEWVGPGNATKNYLGSNGCFTSACTLQPLAIPNTPGFNDNRCDQTLAGVTGDVACAIVNPGGESTPWTFTDKTSGAPANTHGSSELYEGGLDLTGLGFGEACFSTVLLNTRSSPSGTSALQDFATGSFGSCSSGITTTPQASGGGAIPSTIGTSARVAVRDHADISVTGVGSFGGAVKFFLCGPLALSSTTNCSTGGVQIGDPAGGETVTGTNNAASVNSDDATLTSAGRYCWRAEYSGDSSAQVPASKDPSKSVADGGTTSECFSIGPVTPVLTTTAGADVTLTNPITDTASLTGTAKQPGTGGLGGAETIAPGSINALATTQLDAGGTITFDVRGPGNCTASGLTVTGSPVTVSGDNASYGPVSATPTAIGTYTFVATYSGNSPNTNGAAGTCPPGANDGDEEVTVTGVATLGTAQRWLPNDTAHITGSTGTTLSGTVTFTLYNDGTCGTGTGTAQYGPVTKNVVTDANPGGTANNRFVSTTNTDFFVTTANDAVAWSWKVSYDDANLTDPTDVCESTTPAFTLSD
jgi:hypothetical protein